VTNDKDGGDRADKRAADLAENLAEHAVHTANEAADKMAEAISAGISAAALRVAGPLSKAVRDGGDTIQGFLNGLFAPMYDEDDEDSP